MDFKQSPVMTGALLLLATPGFALVAPDGGKYGVPVRPASEVADIAAPRSLPAPPPSPSFQAAALATFQRSVVQPFEVRREPETGVVRLLAAGRSRAYAGDPAKAAGMFLKDALPLFGPAAAPDALGEPTVTTHPWGSQVTFPQMVNGIPVLERSVTVNLNTDGEVVLAENATASVPGVNTTPLVSPLRAARLARGRVTDLPSLGIRAGGMAPRLVWGFTEVDDDGIPVRMTVDAHTGDVVQRDPLVRFAAGQGLVYSANPVTTPTRELLPLTNLDGSGALTGDYAKIYLYNAVSGAAASTQTAANPDLLFNFPPDSDELSQTQAYYGITHIHDWLKSTFNFTGRDHSIPGFVRVPGLVNAYFSGAATLEGFPTPNGKMVFGYAATTGNPTRDYALDTDVLYHEYTHAVLDVLSPAFAAAYGDPEPGGLNEATADYFSGTILNDPVLAEYAAGASGLSYIRDLKNRNHYPEELWITSAITTDGVRVENVRRNPEVHQVGTVWGAALWDLRIRLGQQKTDQLVYRGASLFSGTTNFQSALGALLTADDQLYQGADKSLIRETFAMRGITEAAYPVTYVPYDGFYNASGPGKVLLGRPYTSNNFAYIESYQPLPSYNAGENYFFTGYVTESNVNSVAFVLKDVNGVVVAKITAPIRTFNAYSPSGVWSRYAYFWKVDAFPASLIPAGQQKREGLRLFVHTYAQSQATVDAEFATLTPAAVLPAGGTGYAAEMIVPAVTPPVYSDTAGDTDGNGQVQIQDALLLVRWAAGRATLTADQKQRGDVAAPQNGAPNLADARVVLQRAGGLL